MEIFIKNGNAEIKWLKLNAVIWLNSLDFLIKKLTNLNLKACIPIRDSLTSGYIIPFAFDLRASRGTIKTEEFELEEGKEELESSSSSIYRPLCIQPNGSQKGQRFMGNVFATYPMKGIPVLLNQPNG